MHKVNNVMRYHQMQKHYKHITECDDHHGGSADLSDLIKRVTDLEQRSTTNTECNCNERLTNIVADIQNINEYISQINVNIDAILKQLGDQNTGTEDDMVRISPMTVEGLDRLDTTFAKLLGDVENYDDDQVEEYYANVISSVVGDRPLNDPISVADIERATICSSLFESKAIWVDLTPEQKRAYIKQFILASPSNQARAAYVTNEMLKSFAIVSTDIDQPEPIDRGIGSATYILEEDPTMITPKNQDIRMRGCPYLML